MHPDVEGATAGRSTACGAGGFTFERAADLRVHMIGIGGSGMSGAAALLRDLGAIVTGSDLAGFEGMGRLVSRGVRISIGHRESQLDPDVDLVVASAAVPDDNAELTMAKSRGIRVLKYAQLLGELMGTREGIAIAGTHGKSTTSAMCVHLLKQTGLAPSFLIGASAAQLGGNSGLGSGPHLVVESCEFDRSFLHLRPRFAAILNIEPDHLDCYENVDAIVGAFGSFARNVEDDGVLVCNSDDERVGRAIGGAAAAVETFGFSDRADWRAYNLRSDRGRYRFDVALRGARLMSTHLTIPGRFNVANALAAIALSCRAGAKPEEVAEALPTFAGVDRRMTWRGFGRGVTILDDYAHHPTEIKVTIEAARSRYEPRRTWVVFQPHQYARTRHFMDQFADSFRDVDEVIVPDVFGARETNDPSGSSGSEELVRRIQARGGSATYLSRFDDMAEFLTENLREGDLVMTMGAGDIWKVADELVERFCRSDRARCAPRETDVVSRGGKSSIPVPTA